MTVPATVYEPPPVAWGLGRIRIGDDIVPWAVSRADVDDEAAALVPMLVRLGLEDTSHVDPHAAGAEDDVRPLLLIVSTLADTLHGYPFETAAGTLGALYSCAEATRFDSFRSAALIGYLHPQVVFGINAAVIEGLTEEFGRDLFTVFGAVPAVVVTDETAFRALTAVGVRPWRSRRLGPTTFVEDSPGSGRFAYDPARWTVEIDADETRANETSGSVLLTNVVPRLTPSVRLLTGFRGRVPAPGTVELVL